MIVTTGGAELNIHGIPYHLRHTVAQIDLPVYVELSPTDCRPQPGLALGDTLMVLGLIRNQGRPLTLHLDPGAARELVEGHPLVKELVTPDGPPPGMQVQRLPVERSGRGASWVSRTVFRYGVPVCPVHEVRANPVLAHSLYHGLANLDDRPSVFVDPGRPPALAGLLSRQRPTLALYPFNPGRSDNYWQDHAWWRELCRRLRGSFALVALGGRDYGELAGEVDACLSMDDPASSLSDLAWLLERVAGFAGRDGGLSHLAAAVNPRVLVVWDSMASYRFWAGRTLCHVLMSNPYVFRYPQTARLDQQGLLAQVRAAHLADGQGGHVGEGQSDEELLRVIEESMGGLDTLARIWLSRLEAAEDRQGVQAWWSQPELRQRFDQESLGFAARALEGGESPGAAWVVPVFP